MINSTLLIWALDLGVLLGTQSSYEGSERARARGGTWEIINVITRNQRNKSNIKLIGTWILQTIRPCQKDYHCEWDDVRVRRRESESVYGVAVNSESPLEDPTFQLSIWGFAISWTMCPILFYLRSSIPHSPWAIKYCAMWQNVCARNQTEWLFNSDRLSITNNVLPFNSWHQFKILWSISLLLLLLHARELCTSTISNSFGERNLCTLFYEQRSDRISWETKYKVKWILKYQSSVKKRCRTTNLKDIKQESCATEYMYKRTHAPVEACPNSSIQ